MSEWISVKDRFPEPDTEVLVFNGWRGVCRYKPMHYACEWHDGNDVWTGITHWMPLPETPQ